MNAAQLATVKAYILADPTLSPMTSGPGADYQYLATYLDANADPVVLAWKTDMPPTDSDDAPDYATFDSIAQGKRESWGFFLAFPRNFSRNKVRKWVTDIWGNATAGSNAEAILQAATEPAKRVQVVIGGNTKTTGTVTALDRTYTGGISISDISSMFNA